MKIRISLLAHFTVAALLFPAVAQGQENFPDVAANHWAYAAVSRMKAEGILVGYPDGLFRGSRPASRYEMAVALYAAYRKLKDLTSSLQSSLDALTKSRDTANQVREISDAIAQLQSQLDALKGYGPDIADLKRASDTFELELEQLGVNVEAMRRELAGLGARVSALEKESRPLTSMAM